MPLITGVTHDPDTDVPLTGLWAVRRFTSFSDPSEFIADPEENWSLYVAPGRGASLSLDATTGDELYWAKFTSGDGQTILGPYLFTLTADRTWDDIIANPAPTPTPGGGGGVSGPAAWFRFTTTGTTVGVKEYATFTDMDDGRAYPRPDLASIDGGDATTINIAEGGEYIVSLTAAGSTVGGGTIDVDGLVRLRSNIEVNGDDEAPAYYLELNSIFLASDGVAAPASMAFQQTFEAGDTIQVGIRSMLLTAESNDATFGVSGGSAIALTKIG